MSFNLATLPQAQMDRINVDLAASGVSYKERYRMPVIAEQVEREQPEALRGYFRERLQYYRTLTLQTLPYDMDGHR
ncbi:MULTISPECIES: DNA polymerase III subunit theta [Edwardsiella]|uniref:DNA polymerase III theta subunit n=2 Tax=Edwardsiella anguillarum TaxID=1821960 RepID=A0A076LTH0_9GAMM|nr:MULTISPECIES: DNA polymerase III subunit theta [Edwardsiella]AKM47992.1 DNA polymerase III subunit theta [Edwardsiella sp. EA181011]GAJ68443.1 DNA polymerase III subunit theta [Edwardsiella piscicida]AIJ09967.1 DNA polymerase III theta subunit [Edwardsiella anguillarum ET080813]AKR77616.1 DNA polymerase III subunit theta [Edwardsiella sp. LADL05-105]KAB0588260.1 DNA polymerase III subunit theta [Edwardsiella anguillarum]